MTEERFGRQVGELVNELDPVPEIPRAEIWAGVAAARRFRRPAPGPNRFAWPASLAATLVLGILAGRYGLARSAAGGPDGQGTPAPPVAVAPTPTNVSPGAAVHLARTEALLAAFPAEAEQGNAPEVAEWARQLLLDTRIMKGSPTGANPALFDLLDDLELVLTQIAALPAHDPEQEIQLIQDGIRQNRVLARIRLAAGAAGANGDD